MGDEIFYTLILLIILYVVCAFILKQLWYKIFGARDTDDSNIIKEEVLGAVEYCASIAPYFL